MITQFPAFKMLLVLKFNQFHSKFRGSLLLVFFSLGFCYISVHFDLAQVFFFYLFTFFCIKPPPSSHKPVEELRNPFITLRCIS